MHEVDGWVTTKGIAMVNDQWRAMKSQRGAQAFGGEGRREGRLPGLLLWICICDLTRSATLSTELTTKPAPAPASAIEAMGIWCVDVSPRALCQRWTWKRYSCGCVCVREHTLTMSGDFSSRPWSDQAPLHTFINP